MAAMAPAPRTLKVTQLRVAHSEWVKLRSLRSAIWTVIASVVITVGLGLLICSIALVHLEDGHSLGRVNPAALSLYGVYLAQLTYGVLGILLATSEYSTGMIRSTLAAVPRRLPVLWAKFGAFGAAVLVTSEAALAVSMLAGQAILSGRHAGASLSDPGVLRAMAGAGLYLTVTGLLGVALGFIIRNTAGTISVLFGILLVLPLLGTFLPSSWAGHVNPYLPSNAGQAVIQLQKTAGSLAPWTGFALFAGYTALAAAAAAVVVSRRDA